ncbi:MAG: hypothetical protein CMH30_00950 [Micavibrio sp.]|nr:hypothetical protein [Micavibrio sp.]|tara:strand:+ start:2320 stop:3384 length:1065 start_codon:yes stop_codon:yes gene_type:complete
MEKQEIEIYRQKYADIRQSASRAVETIMDGYEQAQKIGRPFVVLTGEYHSKPADYLFKAMLIKELSTKGLPLSLGLELSHRTLYNAFVGYAGQEAPQNSEDLIRQMKTLDPHGQLALKASFTMGGFLHAPISQIFYAGWLLRQQLPISLIDTAAYYGADKTPYIDFSDPETAHGLSAFSDPSIGAYNACRPEGMRLRNHFMTNRIREMHQQHPDNIIFASVGLAHIKNLDGRPALQDTMTQMLFAKGMIVCAVERVNQHEQTAEQYQNVAPILNPVLSLLRDKGFSHHTNLQINEDLRQQEMAYLQGYANASAMGSRFNVVERLQVLESSWVEEVIPIFDRWKASIKQGQALSL